MFTDHSLEFFISLWHREKLFVSSCFFPPVSSSFHSSCLFGIFEEPLYKMLNLVFLYASNFSPCSKTMCANPFDVELLPSTRCGLGKGWEQCFSNCNAVQATWAILWTYKFRFSHPLGLTLGMAMLYLWFLTLAAQWNHLEGFKNYQCLGCPPLILPQLILGGAQALVKVPCVTLICSQSRTKASPSVVPWNCILWSLQRSEIELCSGREQDTDLDFLSWNPHSHLY